MGLERIINLIKNVGISSLLVGDLYLSPLTNITYAENFNNSTKKSDNYEKILMTNYVLLNLVDAYQGSHMPSGYRELNPLINSWAGDRPSLGEFLLFKTAVIGGVFYLYNKIPRNIENEKTRKSLLWLINSYQLSIDIRNEKITGGILFKRTF